MAMDLTKTSVNLVHTDVNSWSSQLAALKSAIAHSPTHCLDKLVAAVGLLVSPFIIPSSEPSSIETDPPEPPTVSLLMDVNFKVSILGADLLSTTFLYCRPVMALQPIENRWLSSDPWRTI